MTSNFLERQTTRRKPAQFGGVRGKRTSGATVSGKSLKAPRISGRHAFLSIPVNFEMTPAHKKGRKIR